MSLAQPPEKKNPRHCERGRPSLTQTPTTQDCKVSVAPNNWSRPAKGPAVCVGFGYQPPPDHPLVNSHWYQPQSQNWLDTRLVPTPVRLAVPYPVPHPLLCPIFLNVRSFVSLTQPYVCSPTDAIGRSGFKLTCANLLSPQRIGCPVVSYPVPYLLLCPISLPSSLPVTQPCVCSPSADAENTEHRRPQEEMSPHNAEARMPPGEANVKEWLSGSSLDCNAVSVAAPTAVPTTVPTTASTAAPTTVSATGPTAAYTAVCNVTPTTICTAVAPGAVSPQADRILFAATVVCDYGNEANSTDVCKELKAVNAQFCDNGALLPLVAQAVLLRRRTYVRGSVATRTLTSIHVLACVIVHNTRQCTTLTRETHHYVKLSTQHHVRDTLNTTVSNITHYYVNHATTRITPNITIDYDVKCSTHDYHTMSQLTSPNQWGSIENHASRRPSITNPTSPCENSDFL